MAGKFGDLIEHGPQTAAKRAAPAPSDQEAAAEVIAELKLTINLNGQLACGRPDEPE